MQRSTGVQLEEMPLPQLRWTGEPGVPGKRFTPPVVYQSKREDDEDEVVLQVKRRSKSVNFVFNHAPRLMCNRRTFDSNYKQAGAQLLVGMIRGMFRVKSTFVSE
jgi:hypothetical protein